MSDQIENEAWVTHFAELLGGEGEDIVTEHEMAGEGTVSRIARDEVIKAIRKLKKGKAEGGDGIENEVWMYGQEELIGDLVVLLNELWIKGEMPSEWRRAIICPLYKGGERSEVKNYRGISLLTTAYKIYAMVLEGRMSKLVEEKKLLGEWQAGFRAGRGIVDNIYILHTLVEKNQ